MPHYKRNRIKEKPHILFQSKRPGAGVSDLLSYFIQLDDSTIWHKDGALSRHYMYQGPSLQSSAESTLEQHAYIWRQALSLLGDGWMIEVNYINQPLIQHAHTTQFPDPVSALINDERRALFEKEYYYTHCHTLSITFKNRNHIDSHLMHLFINKAQNITHCQGMENYDIFTKVADEFTNYLNQAHITITPMRGHELTSFLHQCLTNSMQTIQKPAVGCFLDTYLSSQDFIAGFEPKMGNQFIGIIAIDEQPTHSYPALLDSLTDLCLSFRWSTRFMPLSHSTAQSYLRRYEKNWSSKAIGLQGIIRESMGWPMKLDEEAQEMAKQLQEAQLPSTNDTVGYGFYNSSFVVRHSNKDELQKICTQVIHAIQQKDCRARLETINATEAFLGTLPCHGDYNLRKIMIDTIYASHAIPTTSVFQGNPTTPISLPGYESDHTLYTGTTAGQRPFYLNLHIGDVGHTLITGPTGQGKSTLIATIIASHRRYPHSRIIIFDQDYSSKAVIHALQGKYFSIDDAHFQLGPLSRVCRNNPKGIHTAIQWLTDCCSIHHSGLTTTQLLDITDSIHRLSDEPTQYKNLNHLTLTDPHLREIVSLYTNPPFDHLLNGTKNTYAQCDLLGIDMSSFLDNDHGAQAMHIPIIRAMMDEVADICKDHHPTLLVLEEAWAYLQHPVFKTQLASWFKTWRKFNVAVILVTQDINDIVSSDVASIIQSSCMTRIFLPNPSATEPTVQNHYTSFGLSDEEIHILKNAQSKRDYYYTSPLGSALFELNLGPVAQAFLCANHKNDRDDLCYHASAENPQWVGNWLDRKGLSDWATYYRQQYQECYEDL